MRLSILPMIGGMKSIRLQTSEEIGFLVEYYLHLGNEIDHYISKGWCEQGSDTKQYTQQ